MEKIEFGKLITEESISNGKIISSSKKAKRSYLIVDKYDAQSKMLEASKLITDCKTNDLSIQIIGDGKGGFKRMEITVLLEKTVKEKTLA